MNLTDWNSFSALDMALPPYRDIIEEQMLRLGPSLKELGSASASGSEEFRSVQEEMGGPILGPVSLLRYGGKTIGGEKIVQVLDFTPWWY